MTDRDDQPRPPVVRESRHGIECLTLRRPTHSELRIIARPTGNEPIADLVRRVAAYCAERQAGIATMTVFAPFDSRTPTAQSLPASSALAGNTAWPITWLHAVPQASGVVAYAMAGVPLTPLFHEGMVIGVRYEIAGVSFCRLAGVTAPTAAADPADQAATALENMEGLLNTVGLRFQNVIRTWFFNKDILSWYDDFNRVRNDFFTARGIRGAVLPASTGIGIANHYDRALVGELLAVDGPKPVSVTRVPSPLQCAATDYGSAFSRALEFTAPTGRSLYISGTASIAPDGRTEFLNDPAGQIRRTMEVIEALLESRGLEWSDGIRAIAFFKDISDLPHFQAYCARRGLEPLPVLAVQADVCRPDLLFEMEFEAARRS